MAAPTRRVRTPRPTPVPEKKVITLSQSLAVKYRPQRLEDLVGQKAVVTVIQGMLKQRKFPGAFLIEGHTGTGKTTTARMIHRYINCETGDACGECSSCKTNPESHMDFVTISAGVNGKVEDIRALIKSSRVAPYSNRRIIVVDECLEGHIPVLLSKSGATATIQEICDNPDEFTHVISRDMTKGEDEFRAITNRFVLEKPSDRLLDVEFEDGTAWTGITDNHPVWCVNKSQYVLMGQMVVGDYVQSSVALKLTKITRRAPGSVVKVYDIEVEKNHNFYPCAVSATKVTPILTHNCHQLTGASAEALLVPIEEPFRDTIWILCTTNPEKLKPTLVNRCVRLSMKPVELMDIAKRLGSIAKREGLNLTSTDDGKTALKTIADLSNGSMRTAISILESVLYAYSSGEEINSKDVVNIYAANAEVDLDKAAVSLVAAVLNEDLKSAIKFIRVAGNIRGLISKTRWLVDYLVGVGTGTSKFTPYSGRLFNELVKKKNIEYSLMDLLMLQLTVVDAEMRMNSTSVDESVLLQTAIAKFARETA